MKWLTYAKLFNIGNYENERIELTEDYDETLSDEECISDLASRVENMFKTAHRKQKEAKKAEEKREQERNDKARVKRLMEQKDDIEKQITELSKPHPNDEIEEDDD